MAMSDPIFVAGGAGYIGSHVCKALSEQGHSPITVDDLSTGHKDAIKWGPYENVDLRDLDALRALFEKYRPKTFFMFSGFIAAGESCQDPIKYWDNNIKSISNAVKCCLEYGTGKFIFSSTAAVYGESQYMPIDENHPKSPTNPYGDTKWASEKLLDNCATAHGPDFKYVALRYFNACGADRDGQIGESHSPETHLIPLVIHAAEDPDFGLKLFGDDYDTPDGTCIRDYIHVTDLANAHIAALNYLEDNNSNVFNVGTNSGFSIKEIITAVETVTGKKVKYDIHPRRAGDPSKLVADNTKIMQTMGWQPQHSDINNVVKTAWDWYKKNSVSL